MSQSGTIEISEWLNEKTIERAYRRAKSAQENREYGFAKRGMNAARARDSKVLMVLEQGTEIVHALADRQTGQYRAGRGIPYSHRVEPTEVALWRNAYETMDNGDPMQNFEWIYGCATELAYGR
jgi:hypothetical protein